ncbi:hypothetical protein Q5752_002396 [Cryptotrichosporon argae]
MLHSPVPTSPAASGSRQPQAPSRPGSRPSRPPSGPSRPPSAHSRPSSSPSSVPLSRSSLHPDRVGPTIRSTSAYRFYSTLRSPRLSVPASVRTSATGDELQNSVVAAWVETEPTAERKREVDLLVQDVQQVLDAGHQWNGRFKVDVFGSVSWGGDTGNGSDVDLVILDNKWKRGYEPKLWRAPPEVENPVVPPGPPSRIRGAPLIYDMFWVRNRLRSAGFPQAQAIAFAATPIVQFQSRNGALKCDVNTNDLGGWYNSSLILHYCLIAPYVLRPMIYALKLWAAAHQLNDSSGARGPPSMSSYCLTLMAIVYLQHVGALPNLQADVTAVVPSYAHTDEPDVVWVGWGKPQATKARVGFNRRPPAGWTPRDPDLTVADALRGFFAFFAPGGRGAFDYDNDAVSVLHGGVLKRASAKHDETKTEHEKRERMKAEGHTTDAIAREMGRLLLERRKQEVYMGKGDLGIQPKNWAEKRLIVQDPFLWEKNCAGGMSKDGLDRFLAAVDHANLVLTSAGLSATPDTLLSPSTYSTPRRKPVRNGRGRLESPLSRNGIAGLLAQPGL